MSNPSSPGQGNAADAPSSSEAPPNNPAVQFVLPPPDFDAESAREALQDLFARLKQSGQNPLDPSQAPEESVEDEINRQITQTELARGSKLSDAEKQRIADRIRSIREGGWLEALKAELVGQESVDMRYWNRLVAEYEGTIAKVADINARAERQMAEKDSEINAIRLEAETDLAAYQDAIAESQGGIYRLEERMKEEVDALNEELNTAQDLGEDLTAITEENLNLREENERLREELDQEKSKPQADTTRNTSAGSAFEAEEINRLRNVVDSLQKELSRGKSNSQNDDELKAATQRWIDALKSEKSLRDKAQRNEEQMGELEAEVKRLSEENKDLQIAVAAEGKGDHREVQSLRRRVKELEFELRLTKAQHAEKIEALEQENHDLGAAAALAEDINGTDVLRGRIAELRSELRKCQDRLTTPGKENQDLGGGAFATSDSNKAVEALLRKRVAELESEIKAEEEMCKKKKKDLESKLNEALKGLESGNAAPQASAQDPEHIYAELRAQRDMFRDKWARGVVEGDDHLNQYWEAVENTNREINELYREIERLCRAVGIQDDIIDARRALENVVAQVTGPASEGRESVLLTIANLRFELMTARVRNESLQDELDNAQMSKTDDEIKALLRSVEEQEVERRVTLRTQTYRDYRARLLAHILSADVEFRTLANTSVDGAAIADIADRYLLPTTLPSILPAQGGRQS